LREDKRQDRRVFGAVIAEMMFEMMLTLPSRRCSHGIHLTHRQPPSTTSAMADPVAEKSAFLKMYMR
jgi:hypothetical protein